MEELIKRLSVKNIDIGIDFNCVPEDFEEQLEEEGIDALEEYLTNAYIENRIWKHLETCQNPVSKRKLKKEILENIEELDFNEKMKYISDFEY